MLEPYNPDEAAYLNLSREIVRIDISPELFLRSHFPEATQEQIDTATDFIVGVHHKGVHLGLEISEKTIDEVDAYQLGLNDGEEILKCSCLLM